MGNYMLATNASDIEPSRAYSLKLLAVEIDRTVTFAFKVTSSFDMQNMYENPRDWVCCRIAGILRELRTAMPHTHIVLQALLPRGKTQLPLQRFRWPNRSTVALAAVNSRLKVWLTAVYMCVE